MFTYHVRKHSRLVERSQALKQNSQLREAGLPAGCLFESQCGKQALTIQSVALVIGDGGAGGGGFKEETARVGGDGGRGWMVG